MCVLELSDQYFSEDIAKSISLPESVEVIQVSTGLSGFIEVSGYRLVPSGQPVYPNHCGPNERYLKHANSKLASLTAYEQEIGFTVDPTPVLQVRLYHPYVLYVCPFEGDVKVEVATTKPCNYFKQPYHDPAGSLDRVVADMDDEGDSSISAKLWAIAESWRYQKPSGEEHAIIPIDQNST